MNYDRPKNQLTLSELLSATKRQTEPRDQFPYSKEVCRCRYCLYCKKGKCALQSCCCMSERVRAHSCTFTEMMNDCFANVKDSIFRFRLRLAVERAAELHTCFINREQKIRFYEGLNRSRRKDNSFTAQTFLLSASKPLWERARKVLGAGGYDYDFMDLKQIPPNDYTLFCAATDVEYGGDHCELEALCNDEVVDFDVFRAICYAVCIYGYGRDVMAVANKRRYPRKRKQEDIDERY